MDKGAQTSRPALKHRAFFNNASLNAFLSLGATVLASDLYLSFAFGVSVVRVIFSSSFSFHSIITTKINHQIPLEIGFKEQQRKGKGKERCYRSATVPPFAGSLLITTFMCGLGTVENIIDGKARAHCGRKGGGEEFV